MRAGGTALNRWQRAVLDGCL